MESLLFLACSIRESMDILKKELSELKEPSPKIFKHFDHIDNYLEQVAFLGGVAFDITFALEEERMRIARDVHDGPAQVIVAASRRMEYCEKIIDQVLDGNSPDTGKSLATLKEELGTLHARLKKSGKEIREIIFHIRPPALTELGIARVLELFVETINHDKGMTGKFILEGQKFPLTFQTSINLFRTTQEAVNNILKHAGTREFEVLLRFAKDTVNLEIRDRGKGFLFPEHPHELLNNKSMGICNMIDRIHEIKGKIDIHSEPGEGTDIQIEVTNQPDAPAKKSE